MAQSIDETVLAGLRCLEVNDFAGFRALCTAKATVWQNDGQGEQPIGERLEHFKSFAATLDSLRYDVIRQFRKSDEVLQQQVIHLVLTDGSRREVQTVVYFRFEGELIDRIEEYVYTVPESTSPEGASPASTASGDGASAAR
ncbi:nuclear transport factor 2 family protein [Kitasatospora sp. NPDC087314]|uniref:nuclear transport factor 2 family protein n=1 Tax=Kitasatospora sp. NPDC087314 TaxID=3364068 RepID=UPI00381B0BFC